MAEEKWKVPYLLAASAVDCLHFIIGKRSLALAYIKQEYIYIGEVN